MKKIISSILVYIISIATIFFCSTPVRAAARSSDNYDALFDKADEVDGYLAEEYFVEVSQAFDENPADFVTALSKQPYSKINMLSYYLAIEHNKTITAYQATLDSMLDTADAKSAEQDTLFLMKIGILHFINGQYRDADAFAAEYGRIVQNYYQEDTRLFLIGVSYGYSDNIIHALLWERDASALGTLNQQLTEATSADWSTDDISKLIQAIQAEIDAMKQPPQEPNPPTGDMGKEFENTCILLLSAGVAVLVIIVSTILVTKKYK